MLQPVFLKALLAVAIFAGVAEVSLPVCAARAGVRPVSWSEARPIVSRLADALPDSLRTIPPADREDHWSAWVIAQRGLLAGRLARGEEDSLVNLLLFGTSFTREPRLTAARLRDLDRRWTAGDRTAQDVLLRAYRQRTSDLIAEMTKDSARERMRTARDVLERSGQNLRTAQSRTAAGEYLLDAVIRVRKEAAALAHELEAARSIRDPSLALAERSRIFRERGLAPDSSVLTQFAVDAALCALRQRGVLAARVVRRVAIVGPGLDFVDKQEGFDFYEPQSLQPFTTFDSLLRCGLANQSRLEVTAIDVNPRVTGHLRAAIERATRSSGRYRLVFPWDAAQGWREEAVRYWRQMGQRTGRPAAVSAPPAFPGLRAKAMTVKPGVMGRLRVIDANVVYDRLDLSDIDRFDLIIATNVLVYYDTFEQTLAAASLAAMLQPGGVLLTNNSILEIAEVPLRSAGYLAVPFSRRDADGEHMVWYVRSDVSGHRASSAPARQYIQ